MPLRASWSGPPVSNWRDFRLSGAARAELCVEGSACIADDGARNSLEQHPVFIRHLLSHANKNLPTTLFRTHVNGGSNQVHDPVLQSLPVAGMIFIPDHQVHCQT